MPICDKCRGLGWIIGDWSRVRCDKCGGDGTVGGSDLPDIDVPDIDVDVPELELPELDLPDLPSSGYETNKWDQMERVERDGWKAAWASDISETKLASGIVAAGVSISSANPTPFLVWIEALVKESVASLEQSISHQFPSYLIGELRSLAADTIKAAVSGKSAKEVLRKYDTVDFKAGAIEYSGKNVGVGITISKTWGIKPYVALRWTETSTSGPSTTTEGPSLPSDPPSTSFGSAFVTQGYGTFTYQGHGKWILQGSPSPTSLAFSEAERTHSYIEIHCTTTDQEFFHVRLYRDRARYKQQGLGPGQASVWREFPESFGKWR